jgi:hypothetical protein
MGWGETGLPDNGALEHDKHEQREQAVVPTLGQTPIARCKTFRRDEERSRCVFTEKVQRKMESECRMNSFLPYGDFEPGSLSELRPFGSKKGRRGWADGARETSKQNGTLAGENVIIPHWVV